MDKNNIGKGSDAFKIDDDGTIIRINQPSNQQPTPHISKGSNGWIWFLVLVLIIAGIVIAVLVNNQNSNNYTTNTTSPNNNNVTVDENFQDFLSKFTSSSDFQKARTTVSTNNYGFFEKEFFNNGKVNIGGETYCGEWSYSEDTYTYKIGWCESELFAKLIFTEKNGLWYLSGFIQYDNNY